MEEFFTEKECDDHQLAKIEGEMRKRGLDFDKRDLEEQNQQETEDRLLLAERAQKGLRKCSEIFTDLEQRPISAPFKYLDTSSTWWPSYRRTIKRPMDFKNIKKKCKEKYYKDAHEFAKDVRLMFDNALKFNHPNEKIWKDAWRLLSDFERHFDCQVLTIIGKGTKNGVFAKVTKKIMKADQARLFVDPVDWVKYKIPKYPEEIKRPFCLNKLVWRCYSYLDEKSFKFDFNQVFDNAKNFHAPDTDIYLTAHTLQKQGLRLLRDSLLELRGIIVPKKESEEKITKKLSQDELVWLKENFYKLDADRLPPIIEKLQPYAKTEDPDSEPEINLDDLPEDIASTTYNYVKESLEIQEKLNRGAGITT